MFERFPDEALAAVTLGLRAARTGRVRAALAAILAERGGEAALPVLAREMTAGPHLSARVVAAHTLLDAGREEAVAAMLSEWRRVVDPVPGVESLIRFLYGSGDPAAIRAMAEAWYDRAGRTRYLVVVALHDMDELFRGDTRASDEAMGAIEDLLVSALTDTAMEAPGSYFWNDVSFDDPRVCDMAGHLLSTRFGDRYPFDISAPLPERDRQRLGLVDLWREARGMPPLGPPEPPVPPAPEEVTAPLIARAVEGNGEARGALRDLGLRALPAVRSALAELPEAHAVRPALEALARELSLRVGRVEIDPRSRPIPPAVRVRVEALEGCEITSAAIVAILREWASATPGPEIRFHLQAVRAGDGHGTIVSCSADPAPDADELEPASAELRKNVTAGSREIVGCTGGGPLRGFFRLGPAGFVDEALGTPHDTPILIRFGLRVRR
jgi:hypothetical protein